MFHSCLARSCFKVCRFPELSWKVQLLRVFRPMLTTPTIYNIPWSTTSLGVFIRTRFPLALSGNITVDTVVYRCPGIPGAGKTFLASIAVDYLIRTLKWHNVAVLVIYCGYNDAKSQSIDNLIACLIKQILQLRSDVSKELHELYKNHAKTEVFPSLEKLTGILRTEIAKFDKCFIVVDALDEILDESKRLLLLETLTYGRVNIMVTSRPLDSIRDLFGLITDISCDGCEEENLRFIYHCKQCLSLSFDLCEACRGQDKNCPQDGHYVVKRFGAYQVEIEATESDVRNYVQWRIDHEAKLLDSVNKKKALREEIAGTIVQQANGM